MAKPLPIKSRVVGHSQLGASASCCNSSRLCCQGWGLGGRRSNAIERLGSIALHRNQKRQLRQHGSLRHREQDGPHLQNLVASGSKPVVSVSRIKS